MATKTKATSNNTLKTARKALHIVINILIYVLAIYIVVNAGRAIYDTSYQIFGSTGVTEGEGIDVYIKIDQGESTMNVANKLEQNKVIENPYSFYIHAKLKGYPIMPGTFTLNTSMNYDEIFEVITEPQVEEEIEAGEEGDTNDSQQEGN